MERTRTVGYLRVSTVEQDLEKNKHEILELANNKNFGKVEWVEEKVSGKKNWKHRKSLWHMLKHLPTFITAKRAFEPK